MATHELQWVGVCCALASNACTSLGLLFQEQSAKTEASLPICRRRRLLVGLALNIGSEAVLSSTALAFAPLSALAPMGATSVVFNGTFLHVGVVGRQRKMRRSQWAVTLLLSGAIAACAIAGEHRARTLDEILLHATRPPMLPVSIGVLGATTILASIDLCRCHSSAGSTLVAVALSGLTIVCFKITILGAVQYVSDGWRVPSGAEVIVPCIVVLPALAGFQLYMLNRALKGDARFVLPTYTSLSMIVVLTYSVMLGEFAYTHVASLALLSCSLPVVVFCLFILQRMASRTDDVVHPAAHVTL